VSSSLVEFVLFLGVLAGIARFGLRPPSQVSVDRWSERHGVPRQPEGRALIERYLGWTRRSRAAGAFLGVLAFGKWILYDRMDDPQPGVAPWLILAVAGYLLGTVAAEVTLRTLDRPMVPAAGLRRRVSEMYVPTFATATLWVLPTVCLACAAAYVSIADQAHLSMRLGIVITPTIMGFLLAIGIRWIVRLVVNRPQPAVSEEVVLVDDATRSASLHAITGAAIALDLILFSVVTSELEMALEARYPHTRIDLISVLTVGSLLLAFASWFLLGHARTVPPTQRLEEATR
jgi:hypothetical protein